MIIIQEQILKDEIQKIKSSLKTISAICDVFSYLTPNDCRTFQHMKYITDVSFVCIPSFFPLDCKQNYTQDTSIILDSLKNVDYVVVFTILEEILKIIKPNVLIHSKLTQNMNVSELCGISYIYN